MTAGQPPDTPEPLPGQMDVYEVLAEIDQEGIASEPRKATRPTKGSPVSADAPSRPLTAAEVVAKRLRQETS